MVTPGSIWASEGDESAFAAPTEMAGQALGDMPDNTEFESTNSDADTLLDFAAGAAAPEGIVGGSVLGTDTEALAEAGSAMGEPELEEHAEKAASTVSKAAKGTKKKTHTRKIYVWLPMTFPEVPAKGDFDVTRLRASKYFFH